MQQGSSWTFLSVGTRRDYPLRKGCGNRTADRLTSDGGASDDANPGAAGANPNAFCASPNDADGPNALARASDVPSALVPARDDRQRLAL
jgi:hypothetical protein